MRTFALFLTIIITLFAESTLYGSLPPYPLTKYKESLNEQDSLQKLQVLYNGLTWTNKYRRYLGDQFFLSNLFLSGTVSIKGHTYTNLRLKYDIYSDEILTPLNRDEIIQLNKERVDSFTITDKNKTWRFVNFRNDSSSVLNGYCHPLYSGRTSLYARYQKTISTSVTTNSDGEFNQAFITVIVKDNVAYEVRKKKDLYRVLNDRLEEIKTFLSKNRTKISRFDPESFLPVVTYYDSLTGQ